MQKATINHVKIVVSIPAKGSFARSIIAASKIAEVPPIVKIANKTKKKSLQQFFNFLIHLVEEV